MSDTNIVKKNSFKTLNTLFWSISASIFGYVISFFVTPYISGKMGIEAYGYVTLTKTIVEYGTLISTALNSYAVRFIGVEYHKKNYDKANAYYNSVLIANGVLGFFVLFLAVLFAVNMNSFLKVPAGLLSDVRKLFILSFVNFAITTIMAVLSAAAYLKDKLDYYYAFRTFGYLAEGLSLIFLFRFGNANLYYIGVGYVIDSLVILISRIWMTGKLTPELQFSKHFFRLALVKELVLNGIWNSINALGNILNSGLDIMITNLMLSSSELGLLGVVKNFPVMFVMVYQLTAQLFQPALLKCYAQNDKEGLKSKLTFSMKMSGLVTYIFFAGFVAIGENFYRLWLPGENAGVLYILTILALLPNAFEGIIYPCYYIYTLYVKNKIPCLITVICGILNVVSMYFLIKNTSAGVYAVLATTVFVMAITSFITNPIYMCRCLKVNKRFLYKTILRGIFSCAAMSVVLRWIGKGLAPDSWISLAGTVLLLVLTGAGIYYLLMFNLEEKKMISQKIRSVLKS